MGEEMNTHRSTKLSICVGVLCGVVVGCATVRFQPGAMRGESLPSSRTSPDGSSILRFELQEPNAVYVLESVRPKQQFATAQSAIKPARDISQGKFRGTQDVLFSRNSGSVLVREDVTDASPAVRFIYFQPQSNGTYRVFYLHPPIYRWNQEPIAVDFPYVIGIHDDKFTITYKHFREKRVISVADIPRSTVPETANCFGSASSAN